jgi:HSP20 family protein
MLAIRRNHPSINLLDSIFENFWDTNFDENSLVKTPIHDVIETEKEFIVESMLAGVKKEDISIDTEKDVLTIKAERKEEKDLKYNRRESYFGKYERSFRLPEGIDREKIDASFVDGILRVVIPKLENELKLSKKAIEIK